MELTLGSKSECFVFDAELFFRSHRGAFEAEVPTGLEIFDTILAHHASEGIEALQYGSRNLYLHRAHRDGDYVALLFHLTDPEVRDRDYAKPETRELRTALREEGEEPAFSAHVLIKVASEFDIRRAYPCIIQQTESLTRTVILDFINVILRRLFDEERDNPKRAGKKAKEAQRYKEKVLFRIHGILQAPFDQTIAGILGKGGRLEGLVVTEEHLADVPSGDETFPVRHASSVEMKLEDRPLGDRAKNFVLNYWNGFDRDGSKKLRVVLHDPENDTTKRVPIDLRNDDILQNAFIKKVRFLDFSPELKDCDEEVRDDLVQRMRGVADNVS